jgi:hypothetical protein
MMDDSFEKELGELLESGDPVRPLPADARSRAVGAMQRSAAQGAATPLIDHILGKGEKKMRRFAYAVAFLVLMGAAATGVFTRSRPADGRALLTGAAQAMEQAQTIHMRGHGSNWTSEGIWMSEDSYELWCSPQGSRMIWHDPRGNLTAAWVLNAELGMAWHYLADTSSFPEGIVTVYYATPGEVAASLEDRLDIYYLKPEPMFGQEGAWGNEVTVREGERDGSAVTVVVVMVEDPSGATIATKEYEIDPATGHLLSYQSYGADSDGRPPIEFKEVLDYGSPVPASLFEFESPPGAIEIEGYVVRDTSVIDLPNAYFMPGYMLESTETWHATAFASSGSATPQLALDGDKTTAWTGRGEHHLQEPGMWFQLDLEKPVSASRLTVHHAGDYALGPFEPPAPPEDEPGTTGGGMVGGPWYAAGADWPRGLQVSITADGRTWEDVPTGLAASDRPAGALFGTSREIVGVRLALTESSDEAPWSITEIRPYE